MTAPPRIARWLLGRLVPRNDRESVLGDADEAFASILRQRGRRGAAHWYWQQALLSVTPLVRYRLTTPPGRLPSPTGTDAMWRTLIEDLKYARRLAARNVVTSLAVVATMVLGIGVTTAVFSIVNGVLLKPLPFADSRRVVRLSSVLADGTPVNSLAYPDLMDFRRDVQSFDAVTVMQRTQMTLQHGSDPQRLNTEQVDDVFARVFAIRPLIGRLFSASDLRVGGPKVVLLGYDLWMREFGGDRAVVGSLIVLDNTPHEVIGVLPQAAFSYPVNHVDALTPLVIYPNSGMDSRGAMWAESVARLAPGATLAEARRELSAVVTRLAADYPRVKAGLSIRVLPLRDAVVGDVRAMLILLVASVAAVLLIACTNVGNLLLGQSSGRGREFAVRAALGGTASRIRRQVVTESLLLAAVGGAFGVLLAPLIMKALIALYPAGLPRAGETGVDWRVLSVATVATLLAGVLSALPAVRRTTSRDLTSMLRDGDRAGSSRSRGGAITVGAQVAASIVLLFSAGLLLRTFDRLTRVDPGFDARDVLAFHIYPTYPRYDSEAKLTNLYGAVTAAVAAIPGVQAVGSATQIPFVAGGWGESIVRTDRPDRGKDNPRVSVVFADAGYERALGIPLRRGRNLLATDGASAPRIVLIDEGLARREFPGEDPLGYFITFGSSKEQWQIAGVVGTVHSENLIDDPTPTLIVPVRQFVRPSRFVIVRSTLPQDRLLGPIRAAMHAVDPTIPVTDVMTMTDRLSASLAPQRFRAALVGGLGALALVLSMVGIFGVVAYAVSRQTREIGIRMALGEGADQVQRRVVASALRVAGIGAVVGVALSLGVGRWLGVFLIGVSPNEPAMLLGSAGVLLAIAALAAYLPARRASRVDPIVVLRAD